MSDSESFPWRETHFTLAEVQIVEGWRATHDDKTILCHANWSPASRFHLANRTAADIRGYLRRNPKRSEAA